MSNNNDNNTHNQSSGNRSNHATTTTTITQEQQHPATNISQPAFNLQTLDTTIAMPSSSTTSSSTAVTSGAATPATLTHSHVISQATVEALGDWLLESASVQSVPAAQEQRRRQSYKTSSLINKSLRQSQEERRKIALAEQAKVPSGTVFWCLGLFSGERRNKWNGT